MLARTLARVRGRNDYGDEFGMLTAELTRLNGLDKWLLLLSGEDVVAAAQIVAVVLEYDRPARDVEQPAGPVGDHGRAAFADNDRRG